MHYAPHTYNLVSKKGCPQRSSMLETVNYFNKSTAFLLMPNASKAFDRVNLYKLFKELLMRDISLIVLILLLYMFTSQTLRVKRDIVLL